MNPYLISPLVMNGGGVIYLQMPSGYGGARREMHRALPDAAYDESLQAWVMDNTKAHRLTIKRTWPNLKVVTKLRKTRRHRTPNPMPAEHEEQSICVLPSTAKKLYPFQKDGVKFAVSHGCAIIGDEMGLGKTAQSIVASDAMLPYGRRLVVCPSTLVENWVDEIESWTSSDDEANIYFSPGGANKAQRLEVIEQVREDDNCWMVVSWDFVRMHATPPKYRKKNPKTGKMETKTRPTDLLLTKLQFGMGIADEAHRMKNRKALQTEALKRLHIGSRLALTGTPIMNRPDELWSLLNWLEPRNFTSYWNFFNDFVDFDEGYFGKEITGAKNTEQLGRLLSTRMIRRLKKDVFRELPDKTYKRIYIDLTAPQRKAYDEMVEYLVTQLEDGEIVTATAIIAQVTRLKQICVSLALLSEEVHSSRKIDVLMELIEDMGTKKMVVFSQFAKAIHITHERLVKSKTPHICLTGGSRGTFAYDGKDKHKMTRGAAVKLFQKDPKYGVYIGTTQAGGVGITLTAANTVVFLDKMWTPADQLQAEDRLHRIGQKDNVYVVSLLARGTLEEHIEQMLDTKTAMIDDILGHALRIQNEEMHGDHVVAEFEAADFQRDSLAGAVKKLLRRAA